MTQALLSLGSNQGAERHFETALRELRAAFGDVRVSRAYRFPAVGFEGPDFLNAGAVLDTDVSAEVLNTWLHALEDAHGRDRSGPRFGDRTLDIDIVYFGDAVIDGPGHLQVPRNEIKHAFVLKPLAEIAPDFLDPLTRRSLAETWAAHAAHAQAFEAVSIPGFG